MLLLAGITLTAIAGVYFCWLVALASAFGAFNRTYTPANLSQRCEAYTPAFWALTSYINARLPVHHMVDIEFEGERTIAIFYVTTNGVYSSNSDLPWDAPTTDSLLHALG